MEALRFKNQFAVPVAATKIWLVALKAEPFHHLPVVVFSTATPTPVRLVPPLADAVPLMLPLQLGP